mgnify:FL=1
MNKARVAEAARGIIPKWMAVATWPSRFDPRKKIKGDGIHPQMMPDAGKDRQKKIGRNKRVFDLCVVRNEEEIRA